MLFVARAVERPDRDELVKLLHARRDHGVLYAVTATPDGYDVLATVPEHAPADIVRLIDHVFALVRGER